MANNDMRKTLNIHSYICEVSKKLTVIYFEDSKNINQNRNKFSQSLGCYITYRYATIQIFIQLREWFN